MAGRHNETILGYCDLTDVENFLLTDIDSSFSDQLNSWIASAEAIVNRYLGYTTSSGLLQEVITGEKTEIRVNSNGDLMIFPRKAPIISVEKIQLVKGTDSLDLTLLSDTTPKYDIPATNDYIQYPGTELALSGSSVVTNFWDVRHSRGFVKLDYTAGYTEVPYAIRMATVNLVAEMVMRHVNKEGLELITQGRVTKRWANKDGKSDFYQDALELLKPYRLTSLWI